jgi:ABC-type glucose/galactose transport system permease subunit
MSARDLVAAVRRLDHAAAVGLVLACRSRAEHSDRMAAVFGALGEFVADVRAEDSAALDAIARDLDAVANLVEGGVPPYDGDDG